MRVFRSLDGEFRLGALLPGCVKAEAVLHRSAEAFGSASPSSSLRELWRGAWFFVTLAPTSSLVPIATGVGAERRMYLPLAALAVLVVISVVLAWERVAA